MALLLFAFPQERKRIAFCFPARRSSRHATQFHPANGAVRERRQQKLPVMQQPTEPVPGDGFSGAAESSVWIPFCRGLPRGVKPALQKQRPQSCDARKNQQAKTNSRALRLRVNLLDATKDEEKCKQSAGQSVGVHRAHHDTGNCLSHACPRWELRDRSDALPAPPQAKEQVPRRRWSSAIWKNRLGASLCDSRACPSFRAR